VREPIKLSFGVVNGVILGILVLDSSPGAPRQGQFQGFFTHWFKSSIFCTEIYSTHAWKVENISARRIYCWNRRFIGFPKIQSSSRSKLGFKRNMQKFNGICNWLMCIYHGSGAKSALCDCPAVYTVLACQCDVGGSQDDTCDKTSGQCNCKPRINGLRCDRFVRPSVCLSHVTSLSASC